MKTITELQAELRQAAARLEALSGDVAALQSTEQKKGLNFQSIQTVGKRYPLPTHCMKKQSRDFQKRYFTLLSALLLLECKNPENGWLFVQRLVTTVGCPAALADLQADAARLTADQLDQTTAEIIAKELEHGLLMDMMLLYLASEGVDAGREYIAAIAELLGSQVGQMQELAKLAKLIAERDAEKLRSIQNDTEINLRPLIGGYISPSPYVTQRTKDSICIYGDGKTPVPENILGQIQFSDRVRRIQVYDAVFTKNPVSFRDGDSLLLDGCIIQDIQGCYDEVFSSNGGDSIFLCKDIRKVEITNCKFKQLKNIGKKYALKFKEIENYMIEDCILEDVNCLPSGLKEMSYMLRGFMPIDYSVAWQVTECRGQMKNVTARQISADYWFRASDSNISAENCFYSGCSGETNGLPSGFQYKESLL